MTEEQIKEVEKMSNALRHRGPDHSACLQVGRYLMGFHRLAIVGVGPSGNQPFEKDGSFLICNGQIYNFKQLCEKHDLASVRSDVDVLFHVIESPDINKPGRVPERGRR